MAITVKDPNVASAKWSTRAGAAASDYANGVANSQKDQAGDAAAAAPLWAASVQAAAANGTFAKHVLAAGTGKWKAGVASKGAQRYPQGVSTAKAAYATAVQPYFSAIANLTLPPRNVKGNNMARVQAVTDALIKTRQGL
jgi:hypothetical protein